MFTENERMVTGMAKYIYLNAALAIADYAADEHPYDKDPERPETYSDYNQGWNDACDYIRGKLENMPVTGGSLARHGRWQYFRKQNVAVFTNCSFERDLDENFGNAVSCPNCGAMMDGVHDG